MHVTNLNPKDTIGASAWLIETGGHNILLDAGTSPGTEGREGLPLYGQVRDVDVEAIAITHCHQDHCGSLPVALRHFPRARVLMTEPSYLLIERVLHNSVNVMKRQRAEKGIQDYPLYNHGEIDELSYLFQGFKYGKTEPWGAVSPKNVGAVSPTVSFHHAGHVLGSAGLRVARGKESLFYTGDACLHDQTLTPRADFGGVNADILLLETTRGTTQTPIPFSRQSISDQLIKSIAAGFEKGGGVLVPVFALGRTQEVLAAIALAMQSGALKRQPVFIGGLGRVFTEIYDHVGPKAPNLRPDLILQEELDLRVLEYRELERLNLNNKLFVITAGMMSEHTLSHELALRMAPEEFHSILFVGYAAPDTPAGAMRSADPGVPFTFNPGAPKIVRNCQLECFDLSAHANREDLVDFAVTMAPRSVVLGHGEPEARQWFDDALRERMPRLNILQPSPGETLSL